MVLFCLYSFCSPINNNCQPRRLSKSSLSKKEGPPFYNQKNKQWVANIIVYNVVVGAISQSVILWAGLILPILHYCQGKQARIDDVRELF